MSVVPMRFRALAPVANVRRALAERLELSWSVGRPTRVAAGALAAALGLTVVVAWLTGDEALMRVHPLFPPMPYSVAIGLLVCGVALLAGAGGWRRLAGASAGVVFIVGLAPLAQYGLGVDWNLHRLLLGGLIGGAPAGMSPSSALSFVLVGVGLVAVSLHPQRGSFTCAICGTTVAVQNGVAFIWSGFGGPGSYVVADNAPHVAAGLAVAGIGTIAAAWDRGQESAEGVPRWLPLPVALGIALVSVSLWHQSESDRRASIEGTTRLRAERIGVDLRRRAAPFTAALVQLAGAEAFSLRNAGSIEPRMLAVLDLERTPSLFGIALLDEDLEVRWAEVRSPVALPFPRIGADDRARSAVVENAARQLPTAVDPIELASGESAFAVAVPVLDGDRVAGSVVGLFRHEDFFLATIGEDVGAEYGLLVFGGQRELYRLSGGTAPREGFTVVSDIPFLGVHWRAEIWPRSAQGPQRSLADRTLVFGLLIAGLLGWTVQLGQWSARRRNQLTHVNANLRSAIAARQTAQAAQAESEVRFRQIIDAAADVIYRTDARGRLTFVNPAAIRVTKWTRDELIGRDCLSLIRADHQSRARAFYEKQVAERIPSTYLDFPLLTADGQEVWIGQHVQLLADGEQLVGFQAVARDISDRIRVQHELQRMHDAALETARMKSEFVANTSHEIRTPLNGIVGFATLLLDTDLNDQQRAYTDGLRLSAEALLATVNDILDFSKIEAGMCRLEAVSFDLRATIDHSVVVFAEAARQKQLALDVHLDEGLPRRVKGDPSRLRQVLTNLLSNAVKFTDRGSITVAVTTETETESHAVVRFSVRDTGIGIDADAQHRLFQPFVQGDGSTSRRYGGTGLGLAISRQIVELMGGSIGLESTAGVGSTFSFTAKLEKDLEESAVGVPAAVELAGMRALIVCDMTSFRDELVRHATAWGMSVSEAHNGADAMAMLRAAADEARAYGIALLSLQHPREDAMALARSINADPAIAPSVKLVLIPPKGVLGDAREARETGIAAYLPRPVEGDELLRCLISVMGKSTGVSDLPEPPRLPLVTRHTLLEQRTAAGSRILVTDDNLVSQQVTRLLIEKLGYVVETASNGVEAVQAASRGDFALILMDCQMPVMDGYTATAEIRRVEGAERHTPIVAFTASAGLRGRERCLQSGMDDFLEKPVNRDELLAAFDRWISRSGPSVTQEGTAVRPEAPDSIDQAVLTTLEEELGLDVLNHMIECQLEQVDASLERMEEWAAVDRVADVIGEAHRLKGGSLTLGFVGLGSLAASVEDEAEGWTPTERQRALQRLRDACADLRSWQHGRVRGTPVS